MAGNDAFTKILLHFDGTDASTTITESGPLAHHWTANGNAQLDTGITPQFGTAALLCDGTGDYVSTPDSADFTLGSGDWTAECWFNVAGGAGTTRRLFGQSNSTPTNATTSISAVIDTTNLMVMTVCVGTTTIAAVGTTTFTSAGWHHYAAVRTGDILKLFIDGVQESGDVALVGTVNDSSNAWSVGRRGEVTTNTWNGSIDEFRLSVGIARWTANFTPPTAPYDSTISGSTSLTFSPSASLFSYHFRSASTTLTFSTSATLFGTGHLTGSTSLSFSLSDGLTGTGWVAGSTSLNFSVSGNPTYYVFVWPFEGTDRIGAHEYFPWHNPDGVTVYFNKGGKNRDRYFPEDIERQDVIVRKKLDIPTPTPIQELDWDVFNFFNVSLNTDVEFTFSNPRDNTDFIILLTKDANATVRNVTFPASMVWPDGNIFSSLSTSGETRLLRVSYFGSRYRATLY